MVTQRPFEELNLWQKIFSEHWEDFEKNYTQESGRRTPRHWRENVRRMISCGDIREGYYEYCCQDCGTKKKIGFTCKSRLCLRCFRTTMGDWLEQVKNILFEGVVHRQVVLTVPEQLRPLIVENETFLKAFIDAGAQAIKELIEEWRPKKKIKVGIMAVLQLQGRAGNQNPHLHYVVSEGGIDQNQHWHEVSFFDTKKLRKKWQYHLLTDLRKAVRGTRYSLRWREQLGAMFRLYPSGFDCNCMPEEAPVEHLLIYLSKYVNSPPVSIRRIINYDGHNVTYQYRDHRKGLVSETVPVIEFIKRMIQHLPPKGFRMVRYYGIYARPVRKKFHSMVADTLKKLMQRTARTTRFFIRKSGNGPERRKDESYEPFLKLPLLCPNCNSQRMLLIRIWKKSVGVVYERKCPQNTFKPKAPALASQTFTAAPVFVFK